MRKNMTGRWPVACWVLSFAGGFVAEGGRPERAPLHFAGTLRRGAGFGGRFAPGFVAEGGRPERAPLHFAGTLRGGAGFGGRFAAACGAKEWRCAGFRDSGTPPGVFAD